MVVQALQLAYVKAQLLTKSFCSEVVTWRKNIDAQGKEKSKGYVLLKLKHQVEAV